MATTVKTSVKIYVEGGADSAKLDAELRQAFQHLFKGWGLDGCLPKVVACGSRNDAFKDFKTALKKAKPNEKMWVTSKNPMGRKSEGRGYKKQHVTC